MKTGVFIVVSFALASFGIFLAWQAYCYQESGQLMPNGHGGSMSSGYGYLFAIILELMAVAWILTWKRHRRAG